MLRGFADIASNRGCQPRRLGVALGALLAAESARRDDAADVVQAEADEDDEAAIWSPQPLQKERDVAEVEAAEVDDAAAGAAMVATDAEVLEPQHMDVDATSTTYALDSIMEAAGGPGAAEGASQRT